MYRDRVIIRKEGTRISYHYINGVKKYYYLYPVKERNEKWNKINKRWRLFPILQWSVEEEAKNKKQIMRANTYVSMYVCIDNRYVSLYIQLAIDG